MSTTYDAIISFYGKHWKTLPLFNLAMTISHTSMAVGTGSVIELSYFDGYMNRQKSIQPNDRADAANALCKLSEDLRDRLESMSPAEIAELDRVQAVLNGASTPTLPSEDQ